MNTLLLDAALGTQLAVNGENVPDWKKSIWSAYTLINNPDAILKIHVDNIEAGADVITTSNYYATPVILAKDSDKHDYKELVKKALDKGLVINVTKHKTIRLLPPLICKEKDLLKIVDIIEELITENYE